MQIHVIPAQWSTHKQDLRKIRDVVFVQEQKVPRELEWDDFDESCEHFLAINELGQHVGCGRLMPSGQIGRMAVLKASRGTGIGAKILAAAVERAAQMSFSRVFLHAQTYARQFYEKAGFLAFGDVFEEAGIEHIAMEMKLPLPFARPELAEVSPPLVRAQSARPQQVLQQSAALEFSGIQAAHEALLTVISSARRRLLILNPHLDHLLFDTAAANSAISKLARSGNRVNISILIMDSKLIVERGHRIVDLARRLDEKISIRRLHESVTATTSSFACADLDGYWLQPNYEKYTGMTDLADAVTTNRMIEAFSLAWEKSSEDAELRVLRI